MSSNSTTDHVGTSKAATRIRDAGIEIFAAKGYGATTTREIAARLGLSPGAMYPHYKTKESLLFAISVQGHESALHATTSADRPSGSPRDRLAATVAAYVIWHARNQSLAKVVQHELRSLSPDHFKYIASIRRRTSEVFARIIHLGNEQEAFHTIDAEAATLAITSLGVDVSRWFPSHAYSDPEVLAERYVELALRMVGAVN